MSPQPKKRPEDEAPEAETPAASETSEDTSAESAAADTTATEAQSAPAVETATGPTGDPVGEEALEAAPDSDEKPAAKKKAPAKKRAAKKKAASKAEPGETPTEVAEEPVDDEPAAPKATPKAAPPVRKRDLPRDPDRVVVVRAQAKYVRSSARKARLVCDNIRGKSVADAKSILAFHPRNVAEAWEKLLDSAVANAENNHELDAADLHIKAVYADEGPTIKRFRPRAHGRATQIRKRTSHLSIQLTTKD
jgi:ribosomal protein L22